MPYFFNFAQIIVMNCIENLIGLRGVCGAPDTPSISGYFATDYPGITIETAAQINDQKTVTGYQYLQDLRKRAMLRLDSDIQSYIAANYRVNSLKSDSWTTGEYKSSIQPAGTPGLQRGIVAYKQKPQCRLYGLVLASVRVLADYTGQTTLTIKDTAGYVYTAQINLEAGVILELSLNKKIIGDEVQILLPSNIPVYQTKVNCGVGCNGTPISNCCRVNGVSNNTLNTQEGYGITANILCQCDLSKITCDLANQRLLGQAAYELYGAMFFEEATMNERISYLTIYKGEQLEKQSTAAYDKYEVYMKNMFAGLRNYLVQNDGNCGCVDCQGMVIKASV